MPMSECSRGVSCVRPELTTYQPQETVRVMLSRI
jgi:hypothetical protein